MKLLTNVNESERKGIGNYLKYFVSTDNHKSYNKEEEKGDAMM